MNVSWSMSFATMGTSQNGCSVRFLFHYKEFPNLFSNKSNREKMIQQVKTKFFHG